MTTPNTQPPTPKTSVRFGSWELGVGSSGPGPHFHHQPIRIAETQRFLLARLHDLDARALQSIDSRSALEGCHAHAEMMDTRLFAGCDRLQPEPRACDGEPHARGTFAAGRLASEDLAVVD